MPDPQQPPWVQAILADADSPTGGLGRTTPALTPPQQTAQPPLTPPAEEKPPLGFLAPYLEGGMNFLRGATGLGDQGPAGASMTNAGALLSAGLPFVGKMKPLLGAARTVEEIPAVEGATRIGDLQFTPPRAVGTRPPRPPLASAIVDSSIPEVGALDHVTRNYPEIAAALAEEGPEATARFHTGVGQLANGLIPDASQPGVYRFSPSIRARLAHFYEKGKLALPKADWDAFTSGRMLPAFGNDSRIAKLFGSFWGATSQGTNVGQNTGEASSAWHHLLERGRLPTYEEALHLPGGETPTLTKIGLAQDKLPNLDRALRGQQLSGPKIQDMEAFTHGRQASPLDRHFIYILGGNTENMSGQYPALRRLISQAEGIDLPTTHLMQSPWGLVSSDEYAYRRVTETLQRELQALDASMEHNPIFSTTWEGARDAKGLPAYGGPADIMQRKGLLEPGAMLNRGGALERALQGHGGPWTQRLVLALLAGVAPSLLPGQGSAAPPDGSAPSDPSAAGAPSPRSGLPR